MAHVGCPPRIQHRTERLEAMMSGMAEVLVAHHEFTFDDESRLFRCECGLWMADEDRVAHQAEMLAARVIALLHKVGVRP